MSRPFLHHHVRSSFASTTMLALFVAACSSASTPQTSGGAGAGSGAGAGAGSGSGAGADAGSGAGAGAGGVASVDASPGADSSTPIGSDGGSNDANTSTGKDGSTSSGGFAQDPIVFVHGYEGSADNWSTAIPYFKSMGYPDNYLRAISYTDSKGSNVPNAMELATFVDGVLADLHVDKVDMVAHSMGGISSRYYIKFLGGNTKVRDMVTLAAVNHGNNAACLFSDAASKEMCPAYGSDLTTVLGKINGAIGTGDDTPFSHGDANGSIYYNALWSNLDLVVYPGESECLDQKKMSDCSASNNKEYPNLGHNNFTTDTTVLANVLQLVQLHTPANP